ncbi:BgtAc-31218 [Blumeria graminis f. sp. tritici]|uniref:BgtAc-31218 n=2 Tax=Blumeria graminis f. sp. tritici TaxID=62690 RepID=A0A9X9MN07_BLUGR|nr:hypothetical protein BGT96224_Ac31218 [Blumeria graminis f. sp. tritici 96224]VDB93532.1 BgtAc-31218 [Blumeria graminis f. sp. tritici]
MIGVLSGQLILRLKELTIVSETSGEPAKISTHKAIPLINEDGKSVLPSQPTSITTKPVASPLSSIEPGAPSLSTDNNKVVERQSSCETSIRRPSLFTENVSRVNKLLGQEYQNPSAEIEKFKYWAEDTIREQRLDIDRISGTMLRIEGDVQMLKEFMLEVRMNLALNLMPSAHEFKLDEVRNEIKQVNEKLAQREPGTDWNKAASLLARNLKTVAAEMNKLSTQAKKADDMRSTLETLTVRLRQLEQQNLDSSDNELPTIGKSLGEASHRKRLYKKDDNLYEEAGNPGKKIFLGKPKVYHKLVKNKGQETPPSESAVVSLASLESQLKSIEKSEGKTAIESPMLRESHVFSNRKPQVLIRSSNLKITHLNSGLSPASLYKDTKRDPTPKVESSSSLVENQIEDIEAGVLISYNTPNSRSNSSDYKSPPSKKGDLEYTNFERRSLRSARSKIKNEANEIPTSKNPQTISENHSLVSSKDTHLNSGEEGEVITERGITLSEKSKGLIQQRVNIDDTSNSSQILENNHRLLEVSEETETEKKRPFICERCGKSYIASGSLQNVGFSLSLSFLPVLSN